VKKKPTPAQRAESDGLCMRRAAKNSVTFDLSGN
jgi:hypothetical protein